MKFNVTFKSGVGKFAFGFAANELTFSSDFGAGFGIIEAKTYDGAYEVTPMRYGLKMPTANKLMSDDVTVNAVPFYVVQNPSMGNTITIGE